MKQLRYVCAPFVALSGKTSVTWASVFRLLILASHVRLPNLLSNLAKQYQLKGSILVRMNVGGVD